MAAKKKPAAAPPGTPLRGEAAFQAAKQRVAEANAAGHAADRAKRDVSEARDRKHRRDEEKLQDSDLARQSERK